MPDLADDDSLLANDKQNAESDAFAGFDGPTLPSNGEVILYRSGSQFLAAAGLGGPQAARARMLLSRTIRIRKATEHVSSLHRSRRLIPLRWCLR